MEQALPAPAARQDDPHGLDRRCLAAGMGAFGMQTLAMRMGAVAVLAKGALHAQPLRMRLGVAGHALHAVLPAA